MTALITIAKGLALVVLAFLAYAALALWLGYEPASASSTAQCDATPAPMCLFTIL